MTTNTNHLDRLFPTRDQIEDLRAEARAAADEPQVLVCEAVLRDMKDGRIGAINTALVKQCAAVLIAAIDADDLGLVGVFKVAKMLRDVQPVLVLGRLEIRITAGAWVVTVVNAGDGVTYEARHSDTTTADEAGSWSSSRDVIATLLRYTATAQGAA